MKRKKLSLRFADGVADITPGVPQKAVSPFSVLGLAHGATNAYNGAVNTVSDGMSSLRDHFGKPIGYDAAMAGGAPTIPSPTPSIANPVTANSMQPDATIGGAISAIRQRQAMLQGLRDGTPLVHGKGGPVDDQVDAKLSAGESVLPADTTAAVGPHNIKALIDATHTPAHLQKQGMPAGGRRGLRFADGIAGIDVNESPFTESDARMFGQAPTGATPGGPTGAPGVDVSERPMNYSQARTFGVTPAQGAPGRLAGIRDAAIGSADDWSAFGSKMGDAAGAAAEGSGTLQAGGRIAGALGGAAKFAARKLGPVGGAIEMADGVRRGDAGQTALGAGDTIATLGLATPAAPVAGAYLGGRALYTGIKEGTNLANHALGEDGLNTLGGSINAGLRKIGLGTNDDALQADQAAVRTGMTSPVTGARGPGPGATAATPQPAVTTGGDNPADQRLATGDQTAVMDQTAPSMGHDPGNSVQGADGVRKFRDASGRTIYSNVAGDNTGDMAPGGQPTRQNAGAAQALSDRYGAAARGGLRGGMDDTPNLPALSGTLIPGVNAPASQWQQETDARATAMDRAAASKGVAPNTRYQVDAGEREGAARNATDLGVAGMNNATSRFNTERTAGVSLRGQDLNYDSAMYGHQLTAASNRARLGYEMHKDDRDYGLHAAEFGQKVQENNRVAGEAADKALQSNLEARYRTTDKSGNSVPDATKIGAYRSAVNATLPGLVSQLEATGDPQAVAKAQELRQRGTAALDPQDHARLQQLFDRRDRMSAARGLGPNQGTFSQSDNLLDYQQKPGAAGVEHRTFGGNRIVTPAGSVSIRDLQYNDAPANAIFPDFNKVGDRNLTRGIRTE